MKFIDVIDLSAYEAFQGSEPDPAVSQALAKGADIVECDASKEDCTSCGGCVDDVAARVFLRCGSTCPTAGLHLPPSDEYGYGT